MQEIMRHMEIARLTALPRFPLVLDGNFHRFKTNATGEDGWYIGNSIRGYTTVNYGDWSKDIKSTYKSYEDKELPIDVKIDFDAITQKQKEEESRRIEERKQEVIKVWKSLPPIIPSVISSYLVKKKLQFHSSLKQIDDILVVPLFNENYQVTSIEYFYPDGRKRFYKGVPTKGLFYYIEGKNDFIYLTESVSNALTLYETTNVTTYASLSAQALPSIATILRHKYPQTRIICVADNDGKDGVGQKCAYDTKRLIENIEVIIPTLEGKEKCDISDIWIEKGKKEVSKQLVLGECVNEKELKRNALLETSLKSLMLNDKSIISHIVNYYNKTAYQSQPGFALISALAFCSIILGRRFKTNLNHHPSLYFMNVGKSGSGKEHQIHVIHELLEIIKYTSRLGPSGYTSPGAILTALMKAPAHITIIDEFGDYLISLQDKTSPQRLVNKCLLQLFGRVDGNYIGDQYSKFSGNKENAEPTIIKNPALTILGGVQPEKLYNNLHDSLIKDGFLGRFLIYETNLTPKAVKYGENRDIDVSKERNSILQWSKDLDNRLNIKEGQYNEIMKTTYDGYALEPRFEIITFSKESISILNDFSEWITNEYTPTLEKIGASQISARWLYMAGSLSLIISLANDPYATSISPENVIDALKIVKTCGMNFVTSLSKHMSSSAYEKNKNLFLSAIRKYGEEGISREEIGRKKPFYCFTKRDRDAIITDLLDAELIYHRQITIAKTSKIVYYAK